MNGHLYLEVFNPSRNDWGIIRSLPYSPQKGETREQIIQYLQQQQTGWETSKVMDGRQYRIRETFFENHRTQEQILGVNSNARN